MALKLKTITRRLKIGVLIFLSVSAVPCYARNEGGTMKYTEPTRKDYTQSIIYILVFVFAITMSAFLFLPDFWYLWLLLVIVGLVILVNWHKGKTVYSCPSCDHVYEISFLTDLIAPHGIDREGAWLLLRCPSCKERQKTRVLKRVE
jgi:uncharacterized C2H2 Zn-finger protein